jgi:hypothetical protein
VIIHPIETKDLKAGDTSINVELFKVTATKDEPTDLLKRLKEARRAADFVAEPFKKDGIEEWRDEYEKEKKK